MVCLDISFSLFRLTGWVSTCIQGMPDTHQGCAAPHTLTHDEEDGGVIPRCGSSARRSVVWRHHAGERLPHPSPNARNMPTFRSRTGCERGPVAAAYPRAGHSPGVVSPNPASAVPAVPGFVLRARPVVRPGVWPFCESHRPLRHRKGGAARRACRAGRRWTAVGARRSCQGQPRPPRPATWMPPPAMWPHRPGESSDRSQVACQSDRHFACHPPARCGGPLRPGNRPGREGGATTSSASFPPRCRKTLISRGTPGIIPSYCCLVTGLSPPRGNFPCRTLASGVVTRGGGGDPLAGVTDPWHTNGGPGPQTARLSAPRRPTPRPRRARPPKGRP